MSRHSIENFYSKKMSAILTSIEVVEKTLAVAQLRLNASPDFEVFISIVAQLKYLLSVLRGDEKDRSRLKHIIVGHFAVREFEESDPEFSAALISVQNIASKTAKGLKI